MRIVFLGRVLLRSLAECWRFDRPFPEEKWGFPLGSELVKGFVSHGHDVHVVMEYAVETTEIYKSAGATVWLVPESSSTKRQFLTLFKKEVLGMRIAIKQIIPDIIFAQWPYYNAYAGVTSGFPTLVVAHDSPWRVLWVFRNLRMLIRAFYSQFIVLPKVKYLAAVSPHIVEDMRRLNRYNGSIRMIPNGIALECEKEFAHHAVRTHATTILMVTQWGRLKNSKVVLLAFSKLHEKHKNWHLIVYGDYMDCRGAGKWLVDNHIRQDGMELRGRKPPSEIRNVMLSKADVFISPSIEESFGMVFIEAMSAGVPCIGGSKSGAVPWVLDYGNAGVLTDVCNVTTVAKDIESLMLDFVKRQSIAEAGIKYVKNNFSLESVVSKYEKAFREIVQCEESNR